MLALTKMNWSDMLNLIDDEIQQEVYKNEAVFTERMVSFAESRVPKWCKHGNACLWQNCPFRHERCVHHDNWISRGKRGYSCRALTYDRDSCKSPEEGGCKYDHRDLSKLDVYVHSLPCLTEKELMESFYDLGLSFTGLGDIYDISKMSKINKGLLIRSIRIANLEYEYDDGSTEIRIYH